MPATSQNSSSRWKRVRHFLEFLLVRALTWWIPLLPWNALQRLIGVMGGGAYYVCAGARRIAYANLQIAFGPDQLSRGRRRQIVKQSFVTFANAAMTLFWAPRLNRARIERHIEIDPDSWAKVQEVKARGKGVIFVTYHYGNWELMGLLMGFVGMPLTIIATPSPNPLIDRLIGRLRSVSGNIIVGPQFALLKLMRTLRDGGNVALLLDSNIPRNRGGTWQEFFGLPVYSSTIVSDLASRSDAVEFAAIPVPLPGGRWKVMFHGAEEIGLAHRTDGSSPVEDRCYLDFIENVIRQQPDHWLWTYKRWKRRPTLEQGRFPDYSRFTVIPERPRRVAEPRSSAA